MDDPYPDCREHPRIYTVPSGLPFVGTFATGLWDRLRHLPPEVTAHTRVFVSGIGQVSILQHALREVFATGFLPSVHSLRNVEADPAIALPSPPSTGRRHRMLVLCRLVSAFLQQQGDPASGRDSVFLAARLGALLDELLAEGVDPPALMTAVPQELSRHWENASQFLALIGEVWPAYLREQGRDDPARCRALAVDAMLSDWKTRPPEYPVLVAGSTATDRTTRRLAIAVASLPFGAIVLPGLDKDLDEQAWDSIVDPEEPSHGHPQYSMRRLLEELGSRRNTVRTWVNQPAPRPARTQFLGQALRPAPVTEAWRREAARYEDISEEAMRGVELIEAASADEEAAVIALALREAVTTPGIRAAFVTEDNELRQRVMARCERWSFRPSDNRGTSLAATSYGRFALQAARVALEPPDLAVLFGLLKNPHCRAGSGRNLHAHNTSSAERILRRNSAQLPGMAGLGESLRQWAAGSDNRATRAEELLVWLASLEGEWAPLACFVDRQSASFREMLGAHLQLLDRLEAAPVHSPSRTPVRRELEALWEEAPAMGDVPPSEYPDLIAELLIQSQGGYVPPGGHPRVTIESTLSARFDPPDIIVFGGLNEDTAPGARGEDPWLNRSMRAELGLPPPERAIGTLAHDAAELFAVDRVVLSRAARTAGETRVASRWLLRLVNLLRGTGPRGQSTLGEMQLRGDRRLELARLLDRPEGPPRPASPPAPKPPANARPRRISITQIERLLKDPYSIYAEQVLSLRPLETLGAAPDARLRGTFLHRVLARYLAERVDVPIDATALQGRLTAALAAEAKAISGDVWTRHWPWLLDIWSEGIVAVSRWLAEQDSSRFVGGWRPTALEAPGSLRIETPHGLVEIVARADRIDVREGGPAPICRLYDYKSGDPPHLERDIGAYRWEGGTTDSHRWAWQLGVAALIAQDGGFEGLAPMRVDGAEYIGLRAKEPGEGGLADAFGKHGEAEQGLPELREALTSLIHEYDDPETPYRPWTLPEARVQRWTNPYDHLSRLAEWAASGGGEDTASDG